MFQPSNLRMRETIEQNAHLFETAILPDSVISFLAHVKNWQAIVSSAAGAVSQADETAPSPAAFSRRMEEPYIDGARRHSLASGLRNRLSQRICDEIGKRTNIPGDARLFEGGHVCVALFYADDGPR